MLGCGALRLWAGLLSLGAYPAHSSPAQGDALCSSKSSNKFNVGKDTITCSKVLRFSCLICFVLTIGVWGAFNLRRCVHDVDLVPRVYFSIRPTIILSQVFQWRSCGPKRSHVRAKHRACAPNIETLRA